MAQTKNVVITTRDLEIIHFLEDTNLIMTAKQIARMFFTDCTNEKSAVGSCRRRLKIMSDKKYIKRIREAVSLDYLYYTTKKAPRSPHHKLVMSEFLSHLSSHEDVQIMSVETEFDGFEDLYSIRPDLRLELTYKGAKKVMFVEVDLTKNFNNTEKYRTLTQAREVDPYVSCMFPTGKTMLLSVCDRQPPLNELRVNWVKTDMTFLKKVIERL